MVQSLYYARVSPRKLVIFTRVRTVLHCRHVYTPTSGLVFSLMRAIASVLAPGSANLSNIVTS